MRYLLLCFCLPLLCAFSGVSYESQTRDPSTKINILILDPNKVTLRIVRAQDINRGIATVNDIAQETNALAAINGGFFRLNQPISYTALPAGVLKIDNYWHGIAYKSRGAMGWDPASNKILFDILQTDSVLEIGNAVEPYPIHVTNKLVDGNRAMLLSDSYIDHIKLIDNTALMISQAKITDIYTTGSVLIPPHTYLYNVSGQIQERLNNITVGNRAELKVRVIPLLDMSSSSIWNNLPNIVGGGPLLIKNGKIVNSYKREQLNSDFVNQRHARTAVGMLENGNVVLVVVEKSFIVEDSGMTLNELAYFMSNYGCTDALNLDGGGSSSMYVHDGIQGKRSFVLPGRPVADALVVVAKQQKF